MTRCKSSRPQRFLFTLAFVVLSLALAAQAQTETLQFSFGDNSGGWGPETVWADGSGNFYGTGNVGSGMVYKLYMSSGVWKETAIHFFGGTADGWGPSASLIFDGQGNVYGSTLFGGKSPNCPSTGCSGVVFELSPTDTKAWKVTVLHTFTGGASGQSPMGLVFDSAGNIFGMTQTGGNMAGVCANDSGCGTVFRLSPKTGGGWQFSTIHTFNGSDGLLPQGNLLIDAAGNLYGSTSWGGNSKYCTEFDLGGCGTVFRLTPTGKGGYGFSGLHHFSETNDGASPSTQLVLDAAGNLYGGNSLGGKSNPWGVVWELSPTTSGPWTFTALYNFTTTTDGQSIDGGLTMDSAGNLYGTSPGGGTDSNCNCGTIFKLSPGSSGWTIDLLHSFAGGLTDGIVPVGNLVVDSSGNVYGITGEGGAYSGGAFYEITP